jgi:hypothetical protein
VTAGDVRTSRRIAPCVDLRMARCASVLHTWARVTFRTAVTPEAGTKVVFMHVLIAVSKALSHSAINSSFVRVVVIAI